jgi:hypothetical protein
MIFRKIHNIGMLNQPILGRTFIEFKYAHALLQKMIELTSP